MRLIYCILFFLPCIRATMAQTTATEIDQAAQTALEQYQDTPKNFYKRLLELERLPNFNDSQNDNCYLGYCYHAGYGTFTDTPYLH